MSRRWILGIAAVVAVVLAMPVPSSGRQALTCGTPFGLAASPNQGTDDNVLRAVSAYSASNAWAVGGFFNASTDRDQPLVMRWNGTKWAMVPGPNLASQSIMLTGVTDLGPSNVWIVGTSSQYNSMGDVVSMKTFVEHYNGKILKALASPNVVNPDAINHNPFNGLNAIAAFSPTNIVADGFWVDEATGHKQPLVETWNGSAWSVEKNVPNVGAEGGSLFSASVLKGTHPMLFLGGETDTPSFTQKALLLTRPPSVTSAWEHHPITPDPGGSTDGVKYVLPYGVGGYYLALDPTDQNGIPKTAIVRWTGSAWQKVNSPIFGPASVALGLAFGDPGSAGLALFAVGATNLDTFQDPSLIVRIKGTTATKVSSPSPGNAEDVFYADTSVKTSNGGDVWAVGDYQKSGGHRRTLIARACGV